MAKIPPVNKLYYFKTGGLWDKGITALLPPEYRKYYQELTQQPAPVHYIPKEGSYYLHERSGKVCPVQNVPIPVRYPKESHLGIWGGEGVVQGFVKRTRYTRRVAHFWFPYLKKSVVYSEVLDKYMRITVTDRTLQLIHDNYGFDHYLLKTLACDLKSKLALRLKREILLALADKSLYPNNPEKREEVYDSYKQYLSAYTRKEIEWYGLSIIEAIQKFKIENEAKKVIKPLKIELRAKLLEELQAGKAEETTDNNDSQKRLLSQLSRWNPFKQETKT